MNFDVVSAWDCEVLSIGDSSFEYRVLADWEQVTKGVISFAAVSPVQRSLIQVGARFMYIVGILMSPTNTEPTALVLFPSTPVVGKPSEVK